MADDRREVLSQAYDSIATASQPAAESVTPAPVKGDTTHTSDPAIGASTPSAPARARDEHGRFAPKGEEKPEKVEKPAEKPPESAPAAATKPEAQAEGAAKAGAAVPPPAAAPAEAAKPEPAMKAPQSFRPIAREKWAATPPEVQQEIVRREREIQAKLQETADVRKTAEEFQRAAQPWEPMFRSLGLSSTQAFDVMAKTYYAIQNGPPPLKAKTLATLIQQSGVPIEALAAALDGQPQAQQQQAIDPRSIAMQAKEELRRELAQQAAQVEAKRTQEKLDKFAETHEFFEDVRTAMADILVARGKTNPTESELGEVYDLACRVHPEISGVVRQREAAKQAATSAEATRRAQEAASSIKSQPTSAAPASPQDRRSILSRRYDELAGR